MEPITRREMFLAKAGGQAVSTPTPITREEMFLSQIAQAGGGGGMGGADWNAKDGEPGHVLNRTHYEETTVVSGDTLTWDGNTDGREKITMLNGKDYYRVSDAVLSQDDFLNGFSIGSTAIGEVVDYPYTEGNVMAIGGVLMLAEEGVLAIPTDNCDLIVEGQVPMTFAKKGIYFQDYVTSLTINGYTGFVSTKTVVHKLDPKYLPDGVPYSEGNIGDILPEQQPTFDENENAFRLDTAPELVAGETYKVNWNGTEYTCVAQDVSTAMGIEGATVVGNLSATGMPDSPDTGEPFLLMSAPSIGYGMIGALDGSTAITISIRGYVETVHPLDEKYLPASTKVLVIDVPEEDMKKIIEGSNNEPIEIQGSSRLAAETLWNGGRVILSGPYSIFGEGTIYRINVAFCAYVPSVGFGMYVENGSNKVTVRFTVNDWTPPAE